MGDLGIETKDERRVASDGRGRPYLRAGTYLQDTPKAQALVSNALVGILGALREPADSVEVLGAEWSAGVPNEQYGFGIGAQHERDAPRVARLGVRECVVGVL